MRMKDEVAVDGIRTRAERMETSAEARPTAGRCFDARVHRTARRWADGNAVMHGQGGHWASAVPSVWTLPTRDGLQLTATEALFPLLSLDGAIGT